MKINVASRNPVKIESVRETMKDYEFLKDAKIGLIKDRNRKIYF